MRMNSRFVCALLIIFFQPILSPPPAQGGEEWTRKQAIDEIDDLVVIERLRKNKPADRMERVRAWYPPAMIPTTISGGVLNVGGHSLASRTPKRPEVPAPR